MALLPDTEFQSTQHLNAASSPDTDSDDAVVPAAGVSLFWRTFFLISALLLCSMFATSQISQSASSGTTWSLWLAMTLLLSLAGAVAITRLIIRPLRELSFAASRMREGDFDATPELDENVATGEIREVNRGFNRMAQQLSKVEQDRALMLAGISHDLRTPLARLRLEMEMSVSNEQALTNMVADIAELESIIGKFLDYARPKSETLKAVSLSTIVDSSVLSWRNFPDVSIQVKMEGNLQVLADAVELGRVITNLIENASRYGRSKESGIAHIKIAAKARDKWILLKIRDYGKGVSPEQLENLTQPFYRCEAARTAANGTGLGLAIVERTIERMGGTLSLSNANSGGLSANIRLLRINSV